MDNFTGVASSTSTPIGGRVAIKWQAGSHNVVGKVYVNTENSQMVFIGAIVTSIYHTKQLNHGQTHQSVVRWITAISAAVCLQKGDGAFEFVIYMATYFSYICIAKTWIATPEYTGSYIMVYIYRYVYGVLYIRFILG